MKNAPKLSLSTSKKSENYNDSEDLSDFIAFGKKQETAFRVRSNNCVIYTRVSSKEQADNNMSLDTQKKYCQQYAEKLELYIMAYFGGTYESAKNDERKEFKRMLEFVKRQKEKISYIIVYSTDRFSRSGANAIYIAAELKKQGITVISVTQPVDASTASGSLQQNIQFIFSEYDNQLRREKCISGMVERLLNGYWVLKAPQGYDQVTKSKTQVITINKEGELIRKAFLWKAEGMPANEIEIKLKALGLSITAKRLSVVFRNVFYCGLITHNLLDGKVVKGRHPAIVDRETFLKANEILKNKRPEYKLTPESEHYPLKRFMICGCCGTKMTGYEVKKKRIHYYKCNKIGCKTNKSAKQMHEAFEDFIEQFQITKAYMEPLKYAVKGVFETLSKSEASQSKGLKDNLAAVKKKIEGIEERFVTGEINRELYEKFSLKFRKEADEIEAEIRKSEIDLSNLDIYLTKTLKIASEMQILWKEGDFKTRQKLQNILFPEGIVYERENGNYRTQKVNPVFELTRTLSREISTKKQRPSQIELTESCLVAPTGIEPISRV